MSTYSSHPARSDTELLRLIAEFDAIERRISALNEGAPNAIADDRERARASAPLHRDQAALLDRICAIRAHSHAGIIARARSLAAWGEFSAEDDPNADWQLRMTAALLRDLVGEG